MSRGHKLLRIITDFYFLKAKPIPTKINNIKVVIKMLFISYLQNVLRMKILIIFGNVIDIGSINKGNYMLATQELFDKYILVSEYPVNLSIKEE